MCESPVIPVRFKNEVDQHLVFNFAGMRAWPLILGVFGRPGDGKSFQVRTHIERRGALAVSINAADLESDRAGQPGKLVLAKYEDAGHRTSEGTPAALIVDDFDTTVGEWEKSTSTVNHQQVLAQLMHLADSPTQEADRTLCRVPVFVTGNDLSKVYAPLRRPGRMRPFFWLPTEAERQEIVECIMAPLLDPLEVRNGDTVTVDYTPGANPIQDLAENDAAAFYGRSVTNNTISPPTAPRSLTATPGNARVTLQWTAPSNNGSAAIVRYDVRHAEGNSVPMNTAWQSAGLNLSHTITGLTNGQIHTFEVRAVNSASRSEGPAARVQATPSEGPRVSISPADLAVAEDAGQAVLTVSLDRPAESALSVSWATHGRGEVVSGSVRVVADEPIGGVLRFDLPGIGVAGVGVSPPVRDALFPVRRQEGGINTGVAVHNLGEEAMEVTCELMQAGTVLDDASIPLAANGQSSWFINEVFTGADTSDFAGSVRCTAPGEGMFTGVAVELDAANRIFITLPVVPVEEMPFQE